MHLLDTARPSRADTPTPTDNATPLATIDVDTSLDVPTAFHAILRDVVTSGTFAVGGLLEQTFPLSCLSVDGVGRIAFPLCAEQAAKLKTVCTQSPFGRGTHTVTGTTVRRSVEAVAAQVHLSPQWTSAVGVLAQSACEKMGLGLPVQAHLYKLLLYETGDFFLEHQDTEKEPGMFGTLLIQLPAEHMGGHLELRHQDQRKHFGLDGPESANAMYYTAFFADVHHQVTPVTAGYRLVLAYNLVWPDAPHVHVVPPSNADAVRRARVVAGRWTEPHMLVLPLDHEYTSMSAKFAMLKGRDRAVVQVLQETGLLDLHLVTVQKSVSVDPEADGVCWKRRKVSDEDTSDSSDTEKPMEDELPLVESDDVIGFDTETRVKQWVNERDEPVSLPIKLDVKSNVVRGAFKGRQPVERKIEGYMGNEGPSVEFIYREALLVAWPRARALEIAGIEPVLALVRSHIEAGDVASAQSALAQIVAFGAAPTVPQLVTAVTCAVTLNAQDAALALLRRWGKDATAAALVPREEDDDEWETSKTRKPKLAPLIDCVAAVISTFEWTEPVQEVVLKYVVPPLGYDAVVQLAAVAPAATATLLDISGWKTAKLSLAALKSVYDLTVVGIVDGALFLKLVQSAMLSYGKLATLMKHAQRHRTDAAKVLMLTLAQRPPNAKHTAGVALSLLSSPETAPHFVQSLVRACDSPTDKIVPAVLEAARDVSSTEQYRILARFRAALVESEND
ncbi:hypothetical protein ACHHYP_02595 [Achlya hypogyna]|uniref:Prolyl 4-hydroxylase alpha subunit Fe(2+) 2OG dioxygenase domain-containing protein n=1 Tax=Achlya hypogyna TaxID=1202772 RepID=A0A1V9ZS26_ACHHY|nr:hypothetical protein ACHHYP_02595 [Achlya hypogyna]